MNEEDVLNEIDFCLVGEYITSEHRQAIEGLLSLYQKEKEKNKKLEEPEDIYPLTIIKDRYSGAYSHGIYTAWNLDFEELPTEINDEDVICHSFWLNNKIPVGKGNTPIEAMHNLIELIKE